MDALLRQALDANDVERLCVDPAKRIVVGGQVIRPFFERHSTRLFRCESTVIRLFLHPSTFASS